MFRPFYRCNAARPDTKVRGRFCAKRCGPSRRRVRTASVVLKNCVRQPEKTFATLSANRRLMRRNKLKLFDHLVGDQQKVATDGQTKRSSRLQINNQLELGRLLY